MKTGTFRVIREEDFQSLTGLACDMRRMQNGLKFVFEVAQTALNHPDYEHVRLIMNSVSLMVGIPELPEQVGHDAYQFVPSPSAREDGDDFDVATAVIPRPQL